MGGGGDGALLALGDDGTCGNYNHVGGVSNNAAPYDAGYGDSGGTAGGQVSYGDQGGGGAAGVAPGGLLLDGLGGGVMGDGNNVGGGGGGGSGSSAGACAVFFIFVRCAFAAHVRLGAMDTAMRDLVYLAVEGTTRVVLCIMSQHQP